MQNSVPWTHVFTSKITEEVRLVGSTINCGRAYESLPVAHVQSYAMATDQAGLQILMHKVHGNIASLQDPLGYHSPGTQHFVLSIVSSHVH